MKRRDVVDTHQSQQRRVSLTCPTFFSTGTLDHRKTPRNSPASKPALKSMRRFKAAITSSSHLGLESHLKVRLK